MGTQPAKTIEDGIRACRPDEPLAPGDERYEDFSSVRGLSLEGLMGKRLQNYAAGGRFAHLVLAGHRGSGKSTELYRLQRWAEAQGYVVVSAQVDTLLVDPFEVDYSDLLLLQARLIEERFRTANLPLQAETLRHILNWFKDVTKITEKDVEASVGISAGAGVELPAVAKFLLAFTSGLRATSDNKTTVRESIQRYPKVLVDNINLLLDAANATLQKQEKRGLLMIFDNLDRYPQDVVEQLMLRRSELLKSVHCHMVYTVPISLVYESTGGSIWDRFEGEVLPMVKVRERSGAECEAGIECMALALGRRLDIQTLFQDSGLARELALKSGGCLRDLIHLAQEALVVSDRVVDHKAVQRSMLKIRSERSRLIEDDEYAVLAQIHIRKAAANSEKHRTLLYRRDALEYNYTEDHWADVHPLVFDTREFQNALVQERRNLGLA